jgi:hypothetical protein
MNNKVFMSFAFAVLMLCSCKNSKPEAAQNIDTQSEITDKEYLTGYFVSDYDGSNLTISARKDGRYDIVISLFRLTYLDDGVGTDAEGGIDFTATDASGEPIGGHISINGDTAILTFKHSTWSLIEEGSKWEFRARKAEQQQSEAKGVEDEMIEAFFTEVFNKEYYNDEGFIEKYCTDNMKKKLREAYEYEYDGEGYAVWLFRSNAQDGEGESKLTKFTPEGGGWYRYEFDDMGTKGSHRIKFIVHETPRGNTETYIDDLE